MSQLALAVAAGVLTVAAPCVLPVLPIVLGGALTAARPARPLFIAAGFFSAFAGVALVFNAFTSLLGLSADALRRATLIGLLLFGAAMVWRGPFDRVMARVGAMPAGPAGHGSGFALGLSLGIVWTPCAGPVLGAILTLLATAPEPREAALLLTGYAFGAALPMAAIAWGGQVAATRVQRVARWLPALQRLFGVAVIAVALAMYVQVDVLFTSWATGFLPSIARGL